MKITLATALLLCALVTFAKANHFADLGDELENFEDELDELEPYEIEDPAIAPPKPPINLDVSNFISFLYSYCTRFFFKRRYFFCCAKLARMLLDTSL